VWHPDVSASFARTHEADAPWWAFYWRTSTPGETNARRRLVDEGITRGRVVTMDGRPPASRRPVAYLSGNFSAPMGSGTAGAPAASPPTSA